MHILSYEKGLFKFKFSKDDEDGFLTKLYFLLTDIGDGEGFSSDKGEISIDIWLFLESWTRIMDFIEDMESEEVLDIGKKALEMILFFQNKVCPEEEYSKEYTEEELQSLLALNNWNNDERELSDFQVRNLLDSSKRNDAAIFSVPGAGKTVEALAFSTIVSEGKGKLIIVCPRSIYRTWEYELHTCLGVNPEQILRAVTPEAELLETITSGEPPKALIINYNRLNYRKDLIIEYMNHLIENGHKPVIIFDESHHFKGGRSFTRAVKSVAAFADNRIILTGTPMPKGPSDLIHQFKALDPTLIEEIDESNIIEMTANKFVRTTKGDQRLLKPNITFPGPIKETWNGEEIGFFKMDKHQEIIYKLYSDYFSAKAEFGHNKSALADIVRMQDIIMYLLMHVSNPTLVDQKYSRIIASDNSKLYSKIQELKSQMTDELDSYGPKIKYAVERARELVGEGKKVLIWSSFVGNVELIASLLDDCGAEYIHGGVETAEEGSIFSDNAIETEDLDEEKIITRESIIHKFNTDINCMVLVANPASAGEGISLHTVCHHAIYIDRTFDATKFMQSLDRIHRYGKDADGRIICRYEQTHIEILLCDKSIDSMIHRNLARKMTAMYKWLEDTNLSPVLGLTSPDITKEEILSIFMEE
jgi:SNF2 family DNA or RNA helicase